MICGSKDQIEMHHIRKVWDLKSKASDCFKRQFAVNNCKQVPFCLFHHKVLHASKLTLEKKEILFRKLKLLK